METELLPVVSADDLKAVYDFFLPYRLRAGKNGAFTVTPGSVEAVCSPGADLAALSHRETLLGLLLTMGEPPFLAPWIHDGYPDTRLFQVMASFPLPVMHETETKPRSFDLPGFIQQLSAPEPS